MPREQPPTEPSDNRAKIGDPVARAQGDATGREIWFESDGVRLFAVERGQGSPVVFLHGGLADHRAALRHVGGLAATHRLIMPDLRGSGRSHFAGELSWDRLADDLDRLLSCLGIERAVVGGVSMGSAVAVRFALRHPERLSALVLMSPLYPGEDRPLADAASSAMRVMAEAGERAVQDGIDALRPLFEALPLSVREGALEMIQSFDPMSVAATTRFLATGVQPFRAARELEAIAVPVMVLPGTDPQHPAGVGELCLRHLRHAVAADQTAPNMLEQVAAFCTNPAAAPAK
jgi:pimeloyl-ACP methyl ester carboxylesterase